MDDYPEQVFSDPPDYGMGIVMIAVFRQQRSELQDSVHALLAVKGRHRNNPGCAELSRKPLLRPRPGPVEKNNKGNSGGMQRIRDMAGEIIRRRRRINDQDRTIHSCRDDLAGEPEPFLPGRTEEMDVKPVALDPAEVERDRRCPSCTIRFHMGGVRVNGPDQGGLACPKCTE